jgi:tetratricopeptide (TPR) repeat protein
LTAWGYSSLALYYHTSGYFLKAFEYMMRALSAMKICAGENHPDIASIYLNLGLMYQDIDNCQPAIDCYMESLYRNIALFGEKHLQTASCY